MRADEAHHAGTFAIGLSKYLEFATAMTVASRIQRPFRPYGRGLLSP